MIGAPQTAEQISTIVVYKLRHDGRFEFSVEQRIPDRPSCRALYIDATERGIRTVEGAATLAIELAREEAQR